MHHLYRLAYLRELDDAVSRGATTDIDSVDCERVGVFEYDARLCQTKRAHEPVQHAEETYCEE